MHTALDSPRSLVKVPNSMEYGHGMPYLSDRPVGEDAYYLLTVAWNLAATHRIVYNFNKPTTGVQPLATFVDAGLARLVQAAGRDRWVFVRVVILVNVVLLILFAHLLGRIAMGGDDEHASAGSRGRRGSGHDCAACGFSARLRTGWRLACTWC